MHLAESKAGATYIILNMEQDRSTKQLLLVNGFFVGAKIDVNSNDTFRNLLHLTVAGRFVAIRKQDAQKIEVAKLDNTL